MSNTSLRDKKWGGALGPRVGGWGEGANKGAKYIQGFQGKTWQLRMSSIWHLNNLRALGCGKEGGGQRGVEREGASRAGFGGVGLVPDVVNDLEGWLDMGHMLAEVAQGCGLSNFPVPGMQGSVSRDHV